MTSNLKARLAKLEQGISLESVVLKMADGREVLLGAGQPDFSRRLFAAALSDTKTETKQEQLRLIEESVEIRESDGAMLTLLRAILLSPKDPREEDAADYAPITGIVES